MNLTTNGDIPPPPCYSAAVPTPRVEITGLTPPPAYDTVWPDTRDDTTPAPQEVTSEEVTPEFCRRDSWSLVVDANSASIHRGSQTHGPREESCLRFYCEDCDDPHKSAYLVHPSSYFCDVITKEGEEMTARRFVNTDIPESPREDFKKKEHGYSHCCSGWMHLGVLLCIAMGFYVYFGQPKSLHKLGLGLTCSFGIVGYIFIVLELIAARIRQHVMNVKSEAEAQMYTHQLRHAHPRLFVKATRYETVRSKDGLCVDPYNKVTCEKVEIPVSHWRDLSSELEITGQLATQSKCLLDIQIRLAFTDHETLEACRREAATLAEKVSKFRGTSTATESYIEVPGYKKRLTVTRSANWCEWIYIPTFYWLTGLLFLTWPYRRWFRRTSTRASYTLVKVVGKPRSPPETPASEGPR